MQRDNPTHLADATPVAWHRLAEPQTDQYDTQVTLDLARQNGYMRQPVEESPTWLGSQVALRDDGTYFPESCRLAPVDHPNIQRAADLLRQWSTVFIQCQQLLDSVCLFLDANISPDTDGGSICGPGTRGFGTIAATVNSAVGLAEAVVHEMGHHKLRALGVDMESAERLITNAPEELFQSPIRYDSQRPMTAVLQAQYSYTYVSALDIHIYQAPGVPERYRRSAAQSLSVNLPKLAFGREVISTHAETDAAGAAFLAGYFAWLDGVIETGFAILDESGIAPVPFAHPLEPPAAPSPQPAAAVVAPLPRPCRRQGVIAHHMVDEQVLYCPDQSAGYALNPSAAQVWELCDGRHTVEAMCQVLGARLGCTKPEVLTELRGDIEAAIAQFEEQDLLESIG